MAASIARRFSRDGKLFAFVNSQGKFVTYDVERSSVAQIYTPNLHLNVPCTCFTWVQVQVQGGGGGQSDKKKKRSSSGGGQTMVAFGTSKGGIALYNPATAQIEKSFKGAGHTGGISGICSEGGSLFTAGNDGKVIEWSLADCEQKKVHNLGVEKLTCLAATQQGDTILAGSKQLKLWDTGKGKMVRQLVGHTSNIVLVEVVNDLDGALYALTGSTNDRNVSLWALEGDEKIPAGLFSLDDAPESISARMEENTLHLLVVAKSGIAHYFAKDLNKINASKPVKPTHTFEVAQDTKGTGTKVVGRLPIFAASLEFSAKLPEVLIAYGSELGIKFEPLKEETVVKGQKQIVIVREPAASFQRKEQEELQLKTRTPTVDKAAVEFLNPVNAGKKALKTVEIPMEDRLENLALTGDGADVKSTGISQKNMAHLLLQGLHSKDAEILRSVFSRNEPELIQRTAERIPAQYISPLLGEISTLMQQKTVHVATAVCWLKALIHSHTSQLMALGSENLLANFGTCLGIIEYRVQHANSLSKLSGRLDLLVNQLDRTERLAKNPEELVNAQALVYHENDESDVDSVLGKGGDGGQGGSSVDDDSEDAGGEEDDDDGEADETVGSILRLRNGSMEEDQDEEEAAGAEQSAEESSSEDDDDDEEMDVSD